MMTPLEQQQSKSAWIRKLPVFGLKATMEGFF